MNHAAAVNYFSTSTETPRIRALYLLRDRLEPLPPRKTAASTPTASNSASLLVQRLAQTPVNDEPSQDSLLEREGPARERVDEVEPAATGSETVSEVTTTRVLDRSLAQHLGALLEIARDERFEDGMDSNLSVGLRVLFRDYSVDFARVLEERLKKRDVSARILAEVFYTLGQIRDDATKDWRLATLADFLKAPSPSVRDAAAIGLAYLDDKRAAPYLREAIERESSETFREDLRAVVEQLSA